MVESIPEISRETGVSPGSSAFAWDEGKRDNGGRSKLRADEAPI